MPLRNSQGIRRTACSGASDFRVSTGFSAARLLGMAPVGRAPFKENTMRHVWICGLVVLALGCGGKANEPKRLETLEQFQKRTQDCASKTDLATCASDDCRWQEAACTASYPSTCFEARCLPVVTDCAIVSSDGQEIPCSQGDGEPHSVEPSPGSGP
jgi:hypothetical protein